MNWKLSFHRDLYVSRSTIGAPVTSTASFSFRADVLGHDDDPVPVVLRPVDEVARRVQLLRRQEDHLAGRVQDLAGVDADVDQLDLVVPAAGLELREVLGERARTRSDVAASTIAFTRSV